MFSFTFLDSTWNMKLSYVFLTFLDFTWNIKLSYVFLYIPRFYLKHEAVLCFSLTFLDMLAM